jgi:hypothetical protein
MFLSSIPTSPTARHEPDAPANPLLIVAMATLCAIGYWSNHHFEDPNQGVEWCTNTAQPEDPTGS